MENGDSVENDSKTAEKAGAGNGAPGPGHEENALASPVEGAPVPDGADASAESGGKKPPLPWHEKVMLAYATGFGAGYSPKAPGTVGTLVGVLFQLAICRLNPAVQALTVAALFFLAVHAAKVAGRHFGNSDDQHIVSDEVVGYLVTMLFVPSDPLHLLAGFVLFRTFDILKPWPCSYFDKKRKDAVGNVMDDVCAGVYGRLLLVAWALIW